MIQKVFPPVFLALLILGFIPPKWNLIRLEAVSPKDKITPSQEKPVEIWKFQLTNHPLILNSQGLFYPNHSIILRSEEEGKIVRRTGEEWTILEKGSPLVEIDSEEDHLNVKRYEVKIQMAQRELGEIELKLKREEGLVKKGINSKSGQEEFQLKRDLKKLEIRQFQLDEKNAWLKISRKKLNPPLTAFLEKWYVEKGEFVRRGQDLARFIQIDPIKFQFFLVQEDFQKVKTGTPITLFFDTPTGGKTIQSRVEKLGIQWDPDSKTFPIEAMIPNSDLSLLPGMRSRVSLVYQILESISLVPNTSLVKRFDKWWIFSAKGKRGKILEVHPQRKFGEWVEVSPGDIPIGEMIVTAGAENLSDGDLLKY